MERSVLGYKQRETSTLIKIVKKLKSLISPKIGQLYQYDSRPVFIPNNYLLETLPEKPMSISIVTPSYNQGEYLDTTITSIIEQNYPNLEFIIQDGGSTDNSVAVMQAHAAFISKWESKKDHGQSNALNLGFQHATGEIMAYLNSDDVLLPGTLAYVARYFAENPDVDVVYGHRVVIDEFGHEIGRWVLPPHNNDILSWADYVPQETLFWRRRIWDKIGGRIDENFKFAMDWDLLLRFRDAKAKFVRLPRFLGGFRVHSEQKTSAQMARIGLKEMQKLKKRVHGRYISTKEMKTHVRRYQIHHLVCHHLYKMRMLKY